RNGAVLSTLTAPAARAASSAASTVCKADYAVANETEFDLYGEALSLSGRDRPARMRDYAGKTGRAIVVTLGGDGVLAATPDTFLTVPALKITP
ncbi:PfkB family carbohydrate kinase, partial [Mesorhizobium sp. M4B.F.Ca.ET.200.01.1.1]|uniref:PfkB family carbohydrate kinase n=1 Tax=Mesorhizobium sp. M4B.F.Ca.ET.200.01.1.1 TaxID=2563952 RepID=UPI0032B2DFB7